MPEIEKEDIDRERERLRRERDERPALDFLLQGLPDDYDPNLPVERRDD